MTSSTYVMGDAGPTMESVVHQTSPHFEHVAVSAPGDTDLADALNDAIAATPGEYVIHVRSPDMLHPAAVAALYDAAVANPGIDLIYTDAAHNTRDGLNIIDRLPDWSPERLRSTHYFTGLAAIRTDLLSALGGYRHGFGEAIDHDMALRASESAGSILHLPEVLVTTSDPGSTTYAEDRQDEGRRAVQDQLDRLGIAGVVRSGRIPGTYQTDRLLDPDTKVSLIIPTRGTSGSVRGVHRTFVVEAVRSALSHTDHRNVEVVVVHDEATPEGALSELARQDVPNLVMVPYSLAFNFSQKINAGFIASSGQIVVLLNDDVEIKSQRWLETLLGPLTEADVGMTSAKLLFEDGTIQHAGHQYSEREFRNAFRGVSNNLIASNRDLWIDRETSGATAACAAMTRDVFEQVGGLSETLPVNFNDVDLSLKIRRAGYRIVWSARTELYHFESRSRIPGAEAWEHARVDARWGPLWRDPYTPEIHSN